MELSVRFATIRDTDLYFNWANDILVRQNSYQNAAIPYEQHVSWFKNKLLSKDCFLYFFTSGGEAAGQVRIEAGGEEAIIGISIDSQFRGKGLSASMLKMACDDFLELKPDRSIAAFIKTENQASYQAFLKAGFIERERVVEQGHPSYKLIRKK